MISNADYLGAVIVQGMNFLLLFSTLALIVFSLLKLRKAAIPAQTKTFWAAIILVFPIFGALAFLIIKPGPAASPV